MSARAAGSTFAAVNSVKAIKMKLRTIVLTITVLTATGMWAPQVLAEAYAAADTSARQESKWTKAFSRLTVGGYGEAVGTYNFYSDNPRF